IVLEFADAIPQADDAVRLEPAMPIEAIEKGDNSWKIETAEELQIDISYELLIGNMRIPLMPGVFLDEFASSKPLGCLIENERFVFRVFAPRASTVTLLIFEHYDSADGNPFSMVRDSDGVWETAINDHLFGKFYGYRVNGPRGMNEKFDPAIVIADPYSKAVASQNHYSHPARTLILPPDNFDWEGDTGISIALKDLIIYEAHVRDMTMHPSAGIDESIRGSYSGFIQDGRQGGISWLKQLGINALELLPVQGFGTFELPYKDESTKVLNTWNPYGRNHWGYMTNYFFAPEAFYATNASSKPGEWNGTDGRQVREMKELVKALHKNGIAVLMDVVYNHVSQYDLNPFKYLDKHYYFRLNESGDYLNDSGCGNDFKSERTMARRMIIDSLIYWMKEYHIDGFRFDLAHIIDWETCEHIRDELRKVNPA
ncbi:MAG: alpha-amylase family glycosyl hydrolase, partial [Calditrichota bacterium]